MFHEKANAICRVFVSDSGDLRGFPNKFDKTDWEKLTTSESSYFISESFHFFKISCQSTRFHDYSTEIRAGANNNEKQDLNRMAGNTIWLSHPPPIFN